MVSGSLEESAEGICSEADCPVPSEWATRCYDVEMFPRK